MLVPSRTPLVVLHDTEHKPTAGIRQTSAATFFIMVPLHYLDSQEIYMTAAYAFSRFHFVVLMDEVEFSLSSSFLHGKFSDQRRRGRRVSP